MNQEMLSEAFANFHFLRPMWFWAFVPMGVVLLLMRRERSAREVWRTAVADHLRPYLMVGAADTRKLNVPARWMAVFWLLAVLALAGPAWDQAERPGGRDEAALVVALDLSRSMLAADIQPSRLERARQKLRSLLAARPGSRMALIGYAGTAHTVVPLTHDPEALLLHLDALSPTIMPVAGTNLAEALTLADTLLAPVEAQSTILLITDGLDAEDLSLLVHHDTSTTNRVVVWAFATTQGAPVPGRRRGAFVQDEQRQTVIARLDRAPLDQVRRQSNTEVVIGTIDDGDVDRVARLIREDVRRVAEAEEAEADWNDRGYWLLIPLVMIALMWFRKGWVVQWMWFVALLPLLGGCTPEDRPFVDYWLTPDQQGRYLIEQGDTLAAAERFDDPLWRGVLFYEMGDFGAAATAFGQAQTPEGFYNLGNTYVELGNGIRLVEWRDRYRRYRSAVSAYDAALALRVVYPETEANKQRVEAEMARLLARFQPAGGPLTDDDAPDGFVEEEDQVGDPTGEEQAEEAGDQPQEGQPQTGEAQPSSFDPSLPMTRDEAREAVLRQMSDDPAVFLRNKFSFQIRQRENPPERPKKTW